MLKWQETIKDAPSPHSLPKGKIGRLCLPRTGRKTGKGRHRSRGSCGPERAWPANTGSGRTPSAPRRPPQTWPSCRYGRSVVTTSIKTHKKQNTTGSGKNTRGSCGGAEGSGEGGGGTGRGNRGRPKTNTAKFLVRSICCNHGRQTKQTTGKGRGRDGGGGWGMCHLGHEPSQHAAVQQRL